jgi:hypothetical protein
LLQQFGYRIVRYNDGTCQLAGEILSLELETGMIAHTTTFVPFFPSSPLVVKGDYNFSTYLLPYLLRGAESFLRSYQFFS